MFEPPPGPAQEAEANPLLRTRRRCGRVRQEFMACQYGPIINLSGGGMLVVCRWAPPMNKELALQVYTPTETLRLRGRVARKKRIGLFKHEVGFEFLDVPEELARKLTALAMLNRVKRAF